MFDRDFILKRAYDECLTEMYLKSQPSVDYHQLLSDVESGKIGKDERVYERYYLSQAEHQYILEKYMHAYDLCNHWESDISFLAEYLVSGGTRDKYISSYTDADGHYHCGYRGYEQVKPIKEQIRDLITNEFGEGNISEKMTDSINNAVMNTITDCKDYYRFSRDASRFSVSVSLGPSPTSNKASVIEYWKGQGVDIEIIDRNPLLFWEQDYYGDEFEEVMIDEYGDDWKEHFDEKWKDQENLEHKKRVDE